MGREFSNPVEECIKKLGKYGTNENFSEIYTTYFPEIDWEFWPNYDNILKILGRLKFPDAFTAKAVDWLIGMFHTAILNEEVTMENRAKVHNHLIELQAVYPLDTVRSFFAMYVDDSFRLGVN